MSLIKAVVKAHTVKYCHSTHDTHRRCFRGDSFFHLLHDVFTYRALIKYLLFRHVSLKTHHNRKPLSKQTESPNLSALTQGDNTKNYATYN